MDRKIKKLISILILLGIAISFPSIVYLIKNKSVTKYNGQNYFFIGNDGKVSSIIGALTFIAIIFIMFIIYLKLIRESEKFKNIKNVILSAFIVGIAFLVCLPNTSQDLFYYMGSGRVLSSYGENPYYKTIDDLKLENPNDEILDSSGVWSSITVVYGPIWVIITSILNKFSFGSSTLLMYIFKITNLIVHLGICYILYKLTNRKKVVIAYAFNPLILLEFMINAHNDIYMCFFIMLGIYFIKNKNNIILRIDCFDNSFCNKVYIDFNFTIFSFILFKR